MKSLGPPQGAETDGLRASPGRGATDCCSPAAQTSAAPGQLPGLAAPSASRRPLGAAWNERCLSLSPVAAAASVATARPQLRHSPAETVSCPRPRLTGRPSYQSITSLVSLLPTCLRSSRGIAQRRIPPPPPPCLPLGSVCAQEADLEESGGAGG